MDNAAAAVQLLASAFPPPRSMAKRVRCAQSLILEQLVATDGAADLRALYVGVTPISLSPFARSAMKRKQAHYGFYSIAASVSDTHRRKVAAATAWLLASIPAISAVVFG
jgi:hypothetical protein